jgi:hypothetical protein
MRTFATLTLFLALAVGGACGKKDDKAPGGGAATCEAAAKKIAVLEDPGDTPEAKAKQDETYKDVLDECNKQNYSQELKSCIVAATTEDELSEKCKPLMGK